MDFCENDQTKRSFIQKIMSYEITSKIEKWKKPKEHQNHTVNLEWGGHGGMMDVWYECSCGDMFVLWENIDNECLLCIENDNEWLDKYESQ